MNVGLARLQQESSPDPHCLVPILGCEGFVNTLYKVLLASAVLSMDLKNLVDQKKNMIDSRYAKQNV